MFYAVAEGRVTEYNYLTMLQNEFSQRCSFRIDMPGLGSRGDDMTPTRVAEFALAVAEEDARRPERERYAEIWAIFDRDERKQSADTRGAFM
ncbi:RloB domain-containing protein [Sphaerimonospora cavernae]|uniref:RloB domain-containing protein n=1 Tax=Sphaerimonospora cavernae TaxID=1740611 RepID=A0ABV6UDY1_9ACTN